MLDRPPLRRLLRAIRTWVVPLALAGGLLAVPTAAQEPGGGAAASGWTWGVGLGLAVDGGASDHDPEPLGLGTHASLTRHLGRGFRVGLQWDGAWFDAKLTSEKRLQLSAVAEAAVPGTPLWLRLGPGLGLASVVSVDLPPPGTVGDGQVSIGDQGSPGVVAGVGARLRPGGRILLEPSVSLVQQWADGFHGDRFTLRTVLIGMRVRFGR